MMTDRLEWDDRLTRRGVTLHKVETTGHFWRLTHAEFIDTGEVHELGGRRHIHLDVVNEQGKRMIGLPVRVWWEDGEEIVTMEAKPGELAGGSFVLSAAGHAYSAAVAQSALPSDAVSGMGLGNVENPNVGIHVAYLLRWQRKESRGEPTGPGGSPPPGPGPTVDLDDVRRNLRGMRALLNDTEQMLSRIGEG